MDTVLGEIKIFINENEVPYDIKELKSVSKTFYVKERYKITCTVPQPLSGNTHICCSIKPKKNIKLDNSIETGENLALISFYWGNFKLSIGTKGDIPGVNYKYFDEGLQLETILPLQKVNFCVAWLDMIDPEREDIYTWLAADPSFEV